MFNATKKLVLFLYIVYCFLKCHEYIFETDKHFLNVSDIFVEWYKPFEKLCKQILLCCVVVAKTALN